MPGRTSAEETRHRLLEAAGEIFAEQGFRTANVRDICSKAGANVAAVNYHFRGKAGLYREVLRRGMKAAIEKYPPEGGLPPGADPEERLYAFIHSFLLRTSGTSGPSWQGRAISREMVEPTDALAGLVEEFFRPMTRKLARIVSQLAGCDPRLAQVRLCVQSILGQCVFYVHCRNAIGLAFPQQKFTPEGMNQLARHITEFSLEGIRGLRLPGRGGSR